MYNVSHAFSSSSGGVVVGAGSRPFVDVSIPVMAADGGGAIATSSMSIG